MKEHEAARWLTRETLDQVEWLPADLDLIRNCGEKKGFGADRRTDGQPPSSSRRAEARWAQATGISLSLMALKPSRKMS